MVLWAFAVLTLLAAALTSAFVLAQTHVRPGRNLAMWLILTLPVAFTVAYAFHPSWSGAILVVSAVAGGVIGLSFVRYDPSDIRRLVIGPLLIATAIQAVAIWGQVATASPWVGRFIEPGRSILVTHGVIRPHGLMYHVYEPPALALLAIGAAFSVLPRRGKWRLALVAGIVPAASIIALTHSRAAFIGFILILAVIGIESVTTRRDLRVPLAITMAAFLIPAAISIAGWTSRLDDSLAANLDDASLGRLTLVSQALDLASAHPIVGVGPNRYVEVLTNEGKLDPRYPWIVHNVPLAIAAELGIPAATLVLMLLVGTGMQSFRAGSSGLALFLAPMGFLMFDVLHYNRPVGLVMFSIWAGLLASLWSAGGQTPLLLRSDNRPPPGALAWSTFLLKPGGSSAGTSKR